MLKKSLAIGLFALAGAAQAAVISVSGSFNSHGYDFFSIVVAQDDIYDFKDTGASFDSLISLFDDAGDHLISGDDSSSGGVHFHLTQNLAMGTYTVLVTSSRAVDYLFPGHSNFRTTDGFNPGGEYYVNGDRTLDGMKAFLDGGADLLAGAAYRVDIGTPVPEPATYALVALALTGLALTGLALKRRRAA